MKVFMLGWEFPPYISGGLGTACYGLTRALDRLGTEITFVLPRPVDTSHASHVQLVAPGTRKRRPHGRKITPPASFQHMEILALDADVRPYASPDVEDDVERQLERSGEEPPPQPPAQAAAPEDAAAGRPDAGEEDPSSLRVVGGDISAGPGGHYTGDLFAEVQRYAGLACEFAADEQFDVIHAHDWMTYLAGIAVADMTGRPLIVHVHSTEFDRSGTNVNQRIYDIERAGIQRANRVICVSHLTRNIVLQHYGVEPHKVEVVYNAIEDNGATTPETLPPIQSDEKIVLFLGRITMQKGPDYFLGAAKRVLEVMDNVRFIMAGSGDLVRRMIRMAAEMGIGHKVLFTGFLRGEDVRRVYRMADLFVMPSVSEPFGLVPLEALSNNVPVLISKQSGVSEILTHALKVDFWDVDEMANKIIAVLRHPPLQATLRDQGSIEVKRLSWADSAKGCLRVYEMAHVAG